MTTNPAKTANRTRPWLRFGVGGGLTVTLVAIVAGFVWFRVCDEQATSNGQIIEVCRHMAPTDPPIVVLGVLTLVLLSSFYAEISGFGITLKRRVTEIEQRTKQTERKADDLEETVSDLADFNWAQVVSQRPDPQPARASAAQVPDPRIADLATQYDTVRGTMPSGHHRTMQMTEVVNQLEEVLSKVPDFDVTDHLAHEDRGVRLAAYAYLRIHAKPDLLPALVEAATNEDKPFGQYCALRALLHQVPTGAQLTEQDRGALRGMRNRAGANTDRGRLVSALLDD